MRPGAPASEPGASVGMDVEVDEGAVGGGPDVDAQLAAMDALLDDGSSSEDGEDGGRAGKTKRPRTGKKRGGTRLGRRGRGK